MRLNAGGLTPQALDAGRGLMPYALRRNGAHFAVAAVVAAKWS